MIKRHIHLALAALFFACLPSPWEPAAHAITIIQAPNSPALAFEAENVTALHNASPTLWVVTNDATASGNAALYQAGDNGTTTSSSFAYYSLKFAQAGTYTLYYRARADKTRTDQDPNGGNSFRVPIDFGDLPNDDTSTNFNVSASNNKFVPPAANLYQFFTDATYTVSQAQVDAGQPLIFKIGTREWGMLIDRFVFSTDSALTEAGFNALANSDTDIIAQGSGDNFMAFEAESKVTLSNAPPTLWVATNDATASGNAALYQAGDNGTTSASSFAFYSLKFAQAGAYTLYYRARADKTRSDQDPNGGNSFRVPVDFGDLPNDATSTNFNVSASNNKFVPPAANLYQFFTDATYTVSQAQVDAGQPLIFKIGTREWGMLIDRFVFSTDSALTEAGFNALPNSGAGAARPTVLKAVGSAGLTNVTVSFDKPLRDTSASTGNFTLSGGLSVLNAVLNADNAKEIILTTAPQSAGSNYVVTINGVADVSGNTIAPNSTISFHAWKLANGWVTRELYVNISGTTVADLTSAPNFPARPDIVNVVLGFQLNNDPEADNYGARITAYFIPPTSGIYEFYMYNDDEAELWLSTDESPDNLQLILSSPSGGTGFDPNLAGLSPISLTAGKRYLLQGLLKQGTGEVHLNVAARKQGATNPVEQLPVLGGNQVATYINPDAGVVNIASQPTNTIAGTGSRGTFTVQASSPSGVLYYQWQLNSADIPGANRATYVTPVLAATDQGNKYRVVITVAGNSVTSQEASLTVVTGEPSPYAPYIGINFVGGTPGPGGVLQTNDVAGVVYQENYNNIAGISATAAPLVDSKGATTPVTITYDSIATYTTGTGDASADRVLLQGYLHNNTNSFSVTLNGVPAGNYSLIVYSLGFNFNATYEEAVGLTGEVEYPTFHFTAQHAGEYLAAPGWVRAAGTDPNARQLGNYVQFDNIKPALDGSLLLAMASESTNTGINAMPPLNGLQLVKMLPITVKPQLSIAPDATKTKVTLAWTATASGFVLESTSVLQATPPITWTPVNGAPNPLSSAGSITVDIIGKAQFYRLRK